ncbi:hypothetical protein [Actinacidiphila oryziradicis]|uniref:Uncharacterized protein n=1 Tax=Actinacidiphila oryziradicis TaxID=2571141 RepID=A0A4U0RV41_9ACTN|nr:hypothetical protein [Actinacidiphila oryziradicis]TJZ99356.1 hypothetical protein FCI23_46245 [Actinacidiphila oryziradicis]
MFVEDLLAAMPRSPESFWGHHLELSKQLVQESITELQIRYDSKIRRAKHLFEKRFSSASDEERDEVIRSLTALPVWGLVVPAACPACDSPGGVRGRDWSGDYGDVWFLPRHFTCPVCELDLSRDELELAGISAQLLDGHEEDPDWEPDFD